MTIISFLKIIIAVLLNTFAQISLKAGTNKIDFTDSNTAASSSKGLFFNLTNVFLEPFILTGLALYVLSFVIWVFALAKTPVSLAYPMLSIGYIFNAVLAYYIFNEPLTLNKILGLIIILIGVAILARA